MRWGIKRGPDLGLRNGSLALSKEVRERADGQTINLQPMSDLDLMIANGWGETPQTMLPKDWRTVKRVGPKQGRPASR